MYLNIMWVALIRLANKVHCNIFLLEDCEWLILLIHGCLRKSPRSYTNNLFNKANYHIYLCLIKFILIDTLKTQKKVIHFNVNHMMFSYMYTLGNASKLSFGGQISHCNSATPIFWDTWYILRNCQELTDLGLFFISIQKKLHKKTWSCLGHLNCGSKLHKPNYIKPPTMCLQACVPSSSC